MFSPQIYQSITVRHRTADGQTYVGDEQVNDVGRLSADFGIEVETTRLNATLLDDCLQQHTEEKHWMPQNNKEWEYLTTVL